MIAQGVRQGDAVQYFTDFFGDIGGPIVQNRLWFYVSRRDLRNERSALGYADDPGLDGVFGTADDTPGFPPSQGKNTVVKLSYQGTIGRYASSAGNPVFWFPASLAVVGLPVVRALAIRIQRLRERWSSLFDPDFTKAVLVLASGWVAMFMLFAVSMGKHSFFYHYQPSYGFAIVLLAGVVARLERRWPREVLLFVALAFVVAIYFALRGAARIFRAATLMYGKRPNLPELIRWLRAA